MGSKNNIFLGHLLGMIDHHIRNTFEKEIYISKRNIEKIKDKHPETFHLIGKTAFKELMEGTIGYCEYESLENTYNFIAMHNQKYYLFALKKTQHHTVCNTIYVLNKRTLKKEIKDGFYFFAEKYRIAVELYIQTVSE